MTELRILDAVVSIHEPDALELGGEIKSGRADGHVVVCGSYAVLLACAQRDEDPTPDEEIILQERARSASVERKLNPKFALYGGKLSVETAKSFYWLAHDCRRLGVTYALGHPPRVLIPTVPREQDELIRRRVMQYV